VALILTLAAPFDTPLLWLTALAAGAWGLRRKPEVATGDHESPEEPPWTAAGGLAGRLARIVALVAMAIALLRAGSTTLIGPLDSVDVKSIYGLRARALSRAEHPFWTWATDPAVWRWHPDYPPGLSLGYLTVATANGRFQEADLGALPFVTALAFLLALPAALARSGARGVARWLFVAALAASPGLWDMREAGHGEAPLALAWLLATSALLRVLRRRSDHQALPVPELRRAALIAGSMALVKGEGLVLALAFTLVGLALLVKHGALRNGRLTLLGIAAAGLGPGATWQLVKALAAYPSSWPILGSPEVYLEAAARLPQIAYVLGQVALRGYSGPFVLLVALRLAASRWVGLRRGELILSLMLGAYLAIYVNVYWLTPYHVVWHMFTSVERILAPLLVPAVFVLASPTAPRTRPDT
jgi:hypothetical protein